MDDIILKLREASAIIKYDVEITDKSANVELSKHELAMNEYYYYNEAQCLFDHITTNKTICQFTLMPVVSNTCYNDLFSIISSNGTVRFCSYDIVDKAGKQYIEVS